MKKILVAGLGSVLMGDDGAGPHVIAHLQQHYRMPENVTVADLGTPGLALTSNILGYDAVILVDTVNGGGTAGEIRRFAHEDLLKIPVNPRVNPHDPAVGEALLTASMSPAAPEEVVLIGIVPLQSSYGVGLSPEVLEAIPEAAQHVLDEVFQIDPSFTASKKDDALSIDPALAPFIEHA